jgi:hypothetical protein
MKSTKGAPKRGGGAGLQISKSPQYRNLKNRDSVDIMASTVLRGFLFSRNQPLKLADDYTLKF